MSSGEYRISRPGAEGARAVDDADGAPVARVSLSSPALVLPEDDLAITRAPTEPLPPDLVAQIATRAVGTDPPPVRPRLPAPPVAPRPAAPTRAPTPPIAATRAPTPTEPPAARMVSFGTTTLLLVPAGDRIALVIPGVVRVTGTREEALALAQALAAPPKR
ncbi:MAG: hypothetical protein JNK64_26935 [Myxococcales bacterium]|nr:hypothetical protein [Myxococcales bacterium]